jgi:hypothetical protein
MDILMHFNIVKSWEEYALASKGKIDESLSQMSRDAKARIIAAETDPVKRDLTEKILTLLF